METVDHVRLSEDGTSLIILDQTQLRRRGVIDISLCSHMTSSEISFLDASSLSIYNTS